MSLAVIADHLSSKGRNGDTMLVHMTPEEVKGLHALAAAHGGELTINPETGLPEASFLKRLLPMIIGAALGPAGFGLMSAAQAGLVVGGVEALRTGDLGKGIAAGFGAYGGANLAGAFSSGGAEAIGSQAVADAGQQAVLERAAALGGEQGLSTVALTEPAAREAIAREALSGVSPYDKLSAGFKSAFGDSAQSAALRQSLIKPAMYAAAPLFAGEDVSRKLPQTVTAPTARITPYKTDQYGNLISAGSYTPEEFVSRGGFSTLYGARGGLMGLADGGSAYMPEEFSFAQRSEPVVRMATGGTSDPTQQGTPTAVQLAAQKSIESDPQAAALAAARSGVSKGLTDQQIADMVNQQYGKTFSAQNVADFLKANQILRPGDIGVGPPAIDYTKGPTMGQIRSDYEKGGGSTGDQQIGTVLPGQNVYTQNTVVKALYDYMSRNPGASYDALQAEGARLGVPPPQLRAALNEYRFNSLTGGSGQAYDYLMGRGDYPTKPYVPGGGPIMKSYAELMGIPTSFQPEYLGSSGPTTPAAPVTLDAPQKNALAGLLTAAQQSGDYSAFNAEIAKLNLTRADLLANFPYLTSSGIDEFLSRGVKLPGGGSGESGNPNEMVTWRNSSTYETVQAPRSQYANDSNWQIISTPGGAGGGLAGMIPTQNMALGGLALNFAVHQFLNKTETGKKLKQDISDWAQTNYPNIYNFFKNKSSDTDSEGGGVFSRLLSGATDPSDATDSRPDTSTYYNPDTYTGTGLSLHQYPVMVPSELAFASVSQPFTPFTPYTPENFPGVVPVEDRAPGFTNPNAYSYDQGPGSPSVSYPETSTDPNFARDYAGEHNTGNKAGGLLNLAAAAAAHGGQVDHYNLGGYSDGGRLLRGPGDGVSDSIPATIGDRQPARLADGEFVVPARIVSELGNGSTDAGARKLYAMMDRVQRARSATTGEDRIAKDTKAERYLPA